MKLSKRLQKIADCVDDGVILADIGSDHAYIPVYLAENKKISYAYACDLREKPLANANKNIIAGKVENLVETCLCSGLTGVNDTVEEVIIAGMGFETIQMILEDSFEKLFHYRKLIIQSNTDVDKLRRWISDHEFMIMDEHLVFDSFFYQIICFSTKKGRVLSDVECQYGVMLQNDPLYKDFLKQKLGQLQEILSHLPKEHEKVNQVLSQIKTIHILLKTEKTGE